MHTLSRRSFLQHVSAGALAAPFVVRNLISAPPSGTLRLASFGAGGMAYWTLRGIATHSKVKLACVAEVDSTMLKRVQAEYAGITVYEDWRRMLDKEGKNLDIVCIGTPDHMHAPMAMMSMRHGLPAYVQKPLTHDLFEARRLTEFARKKKLVTQMGIQIHSAAEYKAAVALIRQGAIGKIKEVHSWSEKKWGDPDPVPSRQDPVPSTLKWDLWLGVCAPRPYLKDYYHPANWRKRVDFGTATFGDMGCHILDPVFDALQLTAPISVRSEGPTPTRENCAINAAIQYVFPATPLAAEKTVNVFWYDGDQRPPKNIQELVAPAKVPGQGSIFVGTKGVLLLPHIARPSLYPANEYKDFPMPEVEAVNHYHQFVDAVLGTSKASASFEYSGPLTEAVLLGTVATRFPRETLVWNAARLKFENSKDATRYVRRKYRPGWRVKGL